VIGALMAGDLNGVLSEIDGFVRKAFEVAPDDPDFGNDVHLFDYGYLDSFGAQRLIEHIESTYKIKISDDDLVKYPLNTLNEISRFVIDRQAGVR
jgi:methoxymalonate biosynthesis acyl carrier protein